MIWSGGGKTYPFPITVLPSLIRSVQILRVQTHDCKSQNHLYESVGCMGEMARREGCLDAVEDTHVCDFVLWGLIGMLYEFSGGSLDATSSVFL